MEIEYEFQTSSSTFDDEFDEEYYDVNSFIYDTDDHGVDINNTLTEIIYDEYFKNFFKVNTEITMFKKKLKEFISETKDEDLEDLFYEEIKDYFESQAKEEFYEEM